ncbi:MAG TPA: DNA cytosine methyltransferase, partial [Leptospiraceae bacterium]|nr:DNA cytosine methyltransferase [Leptospiraceae bacterium]
MKFVDLFCGAGGVTSGIENAMHSGKKIAEVIACVNHDPLAIESHYSNHPNAVHYTEDIRTLNIEPLIELVNEHRYDYICLWASLECTNFSKAKGGLPRDADSRTLANDLLRYIDGIDPDYIFIENVEEFMSWGPLNEHGKPISKLEGQDYIQ